MAADKSRVPRVLKRFSEGDRVTVFFPTLDESFDGIVRDKAHNRTLTVEFPPSTDEPDGSEVVVPWPHKNVSHYVA